MFLLRMFYFISDTSYSVANSFLFFEKQTNFKIRYKNCCVVFSKMTVFFNRIPHYGQATFMCFSHQIIQVWKDKVTLSNCWSNQFGIFRAKQPWFSSFCFQVSVTTVERSKCSSLQNKTKTKKIRLFQTQYYLSSLT